MKKQLIQVRAFQTASEQTVNDKPTLLSAEESELRFQLGEEELQEYADAVAVNDIVEILDSCVDQLYILLGTVNSHGLGDLFLKAFDLVHENNMTKVVDGKVLRNEAGKVVKPSNFKPVDLTQLF